MAESVEEIMNNDALHAIFDELTEHQTARDYVKYLFSDVLEIRFNLDSISEKAVEDSAAS